MAHPTLLAALLDSVDSPILFADTGHMIRYMNRAAVAHYEDGAALIGRSLLACHNEKSQQMIEQTLLALEAGEKEQLISADEDHRIYMRAVRDPCGRVLGYYERYEPVAK